MNEHCFHRFWNFRVCQYLFSVVGDYLSIGRSCDAGFTNTFVTASVLATRDNISHYQGCHAPFGRVTYNLLGSCVVRQTSTLMITNLTAPCDHILSFCICAICPAVPPQAVFTFQMCATNSILIYLPLTTPL